LVTPAAVIFDVDGTLVDSERYGHRLAFNAAFEAFDLPYRWDEETYGRLLRTTGGQRRIEGYLAEQEMDEASRVPLARDLHIRKTGLLVDLIDSGALQARPGVARLLGELTEAGVRLAAATTGSRGWVDRLLGCTLPQFRFDVVVTGDEVSHRKPAPDAFTEALHRLGVGVEAAVAVEDSYEGLTSAKAAGLVCVVVVNRYTADHDLSAADLVLTGFGAPKDRAQLVAGTAVDFSGLLDLSTLTTLLGDAGVDPLAP